jgi:hypothetical protein
VYAREQRADSRQQIADSRQQTADSRQQTADSRQQTADSRQQTADSRQQTADSRTCRMCVPSRALTHLGSSSVVKVPCPHCPLLLWPQAYTRPPEDGFTLLLHCCYTIVTLLLLTMCQTQRVPPAGCHLHHSHTWGGGGGGGEVTVLQHHSVTVPHFNDSVTTV